MSAFGGKADSRWTFPECLLMTHLRHWLCTAPIVSVPIKVPVSADAMLSSELGNRYAATPRQVPFEHFFLIKEPPDKKWHHGRERKECPPRTKCQRNAEEIEQA